MFKASWHTCLKLGCKAEKHPYLRHEVIPIDHSDVQLNANLLVHLP